MTEAQMRAAAVAAGVTREEMMNHPQHGLLISPSGVRKMAARAADTRGKMLLLKKVQELAPLEK